MQSKNNDVRVVIERVKESLVAYLNTIDTLKQSGATINNDTLYEIVDAINTEPQEQEESSHGILYNIVAAPFRLVHYVYSALSYPVHCLVYKSLSEERKNQITYVAKLIRHLESNLNMITRCDNLGLLEECKDFVVTDLEVLIENLNKLCQATNKVGVQVKIGDEQFVIKGLQNPTTGNTSLGELLRQNVIEPHDNEVVLQSINHLVEQNRLVIEATLEKQPISEGAQEKEVAQGVGSEKKAAREEMKQILIEKLTAIKVQHEATFFKSAPTDVNAWQEFINQRQQRAVQYDNLVQCLLLNGEQRAEKVKSLKAALAKNQSQQLLKVISTMGDVNRAEIKVLLDPVARKNDAAVILDAALTFNKVSLFNLQKDKLELSAIMRQIHEVSPGNASLKQLSKHLWVCNVVNALLKPSELDSQFRAKIQELSDEDLNTMSDDIAKCMSKDPDQVGVLINEMANFLLLCCEHIKLLNRSNTQQSLFSFSPEIILKRISPKVVKLEKQMQLIANESRQDRVHAK